MDKKLLRIACVTAFFIWLVNALANRFYWYSAMWWFDIPMHILGGVFLGFAAGALFFKKIVKRSRRDIVVTVVLFVLAVGIGWEFFEYIVQSIIKGGTQLAHIPDSIKDMFMDIVGGVIAACFVLRAIKRYNRAHANISDK
jgi:H+/Cl- antiporter ClcA